MVQHVVQLFVWQAIGLPALDSLHFSCGTTFDLVSLCFSCVFVFIIMLEFSKFLPVECS